MANGLIAFPITPTDAEGRVEADAFRGLLRRLTASGVDGVCVLGSTGTYAYLDRSERRRAVEIAAREFEGGPPLMAGVGAISTHGAIAHARDAHDAGAREGLLAPMSYTPLTDEEVFAHFEAVASEGGMPICIYDNPPATHFAVSDALMRRLAAIPGVVGSKSFAPPTDEANSRVAALRELTPKGFSVGFSTDWNAAEALIAGGDAWYSVLAGLFPAPVVAIHRALLDGAFDEARRLSARLSPMWEVMRKHSGVRVMYAAAELAGLGAMAPPAPILPLGSDARGQVASVLDILGPLLTG